MGSKKCFAKRNNGSFLYDELKKYKREDYFQTAYGKFGTFYWLGTMFSAGVGGFIAQYNFELLIVLGIITKLISVLIMWTIKSVEPQKSTEERKYFEIFRASINQIKTNKRLLIILAFIFLAFPIYEGAEEYFGLLFKSYNVQLWMIGLMVALVYAVIAFANYSVTFLEKVKISALENWLLLISGAAFLLLGITKSIFILPLLFIGIYFFKLSETLFNVKFQHAIESSERATLSSLKSFCYDIFYFLFVLFFGLISSRFGLNEVIFVLGGVVILTTVLLGSKVYKMLK